MPRKRKRMHGAPRGQFLLPTAFFIKFRHLHYRLILTIENITPIFLPKNLIYKYLFVFLQSKSRVPPMDLRLSIDIRAALPHSP